MWFSRPEFALVFDADFICAAVTVGYTLVYAFAQVGVTNLRFWAIVVFETTVLMHASVCDRETTRNKYRLMNFQPGGSLIACHVPF
jgi:hypothetical protein